MLQILLDYLKTTPPLNLLVHMVYIGMVCMFLSASYIVSFHWDSVATLYMNSGTAKIVDTFKVTPEAEADINAKLQKLLDENTGMRVYVYRYHDSLATVSGVPFFFQSNVYELISPGTSRLMSFEQRIPAGIHIAMNNEFVQDKCSLISNTTTDKASQNYYFYTSRNAVAMARCPIFLSNGDLFGFVGIDWSHPVSEDDAIIDKLHGMAKELGNIFAASNRKLFH